MSAGLVPIIFNPQSYRDGKTAPSNTPFTTLELSNPANFELDPALSAER